MMSKLFSSFNFIIESFENVHTVLVVIVLIVLVTWYIISLRKRIFNYTVKQIEFLKKDGKYIPGLFVELNSCKEVLRYFIYGSKWRRRLIDGYNAVYNNFYGDILKKALPEGKLTIKLPHSASLKDINNAVESALQLHDDLRRNKDVDFNCAYKESKVLFELIYLPYEEALNSLECKVASASSRYFILTGSAGNGKTCLLCNISELLNNLKQPVIFINSRDIRGDIPDYVLNVIDFPQFGEMSLHIRFSILNLIFRLQRKNIFIIFDAVNENCNEDFKKDLAGFINFIMEFKQFKIIVSCRNEYYKDIFEQYLVNAVIEEPFVYDLKSEEYNDQAVDHVLKAYKNAFNFKGFISAGVINTLCSQLLLMRVFFEVYQNTERDVLSVRKSEIFSKYVKLIDKKSPCNVCEILEELADWMLCNNKYEDIGLKEIKSIGISPESMDEIVDNSILIGKKLNFHEGTIAETHSEVFYFVFDELRDYVLANKLVLNDSSENDINENKIIDDLLKLKRNAATCSEGVTNYVYIYFRTENEILIPEETAKLCLQILDFYRLSSEDDETRIFLWPRSDELENLGLRILMSMGFPFKDFELDYIRDCILKDSYRDGAVLFNMMFLGTINESVYSLETYMNIISRIPKLESIKKVLEGVLIREQYDSINFPHELVITHKKMLINSKAATQIQQIAEMFLLFFDLNDRENGRKCRNYFYSLESHEVIQGQVKMLLHID